MPSVLPLSRIAYPGMGRPYDSDSSETLPPFLQVAEWPDGTKIWRVMSKTPLRRIIQYVTQKQPTVLWKSDGYAGGSRSVFVVTFELDGNDLPVGLFTVISEEEDPASLFSVQVRDPIRPDGVFIDDSIRGVVGIKPRALGRQVAWFLLEVIGVDPDHLTNPVADGQWIRLGIPSPVADAFFDQQTYLSGARYIEALQTYTDRLPEVTDEDRDRVFHRANQLLNNMIHRKDHPGPLTDKNIKASKGNATTFEVQTPDGERFRARLLVSPRKPGEWSITWKLSQWTLVPMEKSTVSLMDALHKSGIIWPESTYEEWLDEHLVPGQVDLPIGTLEVHELLGVTPPLLLPPKSLWAIVQAAT